MAAASPAPDHGGSVKPRTLALLGATTMVVLLLAWSLQREPGGPGAGELLLPRLAAQLNAVGAFELEPAGREPFRIERDAEGWRAPAKGGYAVDRALVRQLLLDLAEARVIETKTANPALHDRLGVEMADEKPGSGVRVLLDGVDQVGPIVIGQRETRGRGGTYVRRIEEPVALLVDRDLQPEREPLGWLERDLLDVPPDEIDALRIVQPDGAALHIDRDELGIFRIANLPDGHEPSGPTAAEAVARALTALRLDDVRRRDEVELPGTPVRAEFTLQDGMVIEVSNWAAQSPLEGTTWWAAFEVRAIDERAAAKAATLEQRLTPWLYRLPAWKHEQLTRRLADLLRAAES